MNTPLFLKHRELSGLSVTNSNISPGIRRYRLKSLLSLDRLSEVFLGFAADGQFLVSYSLEGDNFYIRFWLIPSRHGDIKSSLQYPFAQFTLEKFPSSLSFLSTFDAFRFLQSINDPQQFVLIFSHVSFLLGLCNFNTGTRS